MATMKTLNGYGFDSAKLGGRAPEYYTNPRNLLYNSDFTNPVNQRGQTTYNTGGYTIDGWSIWSVNGDASLTLVEGGIAFNPGTGSGTFTQKLPLGLLDSAKTYTLAVHKSNGETQVKTDGVTFNHNGNGDLITISTAQETIVWAALYEGSYTADNVPPPFFYPQRLEMLNLGLPVQPRNLLDNSDFINPVNQRGIYSAVVGAYIIDRWGFSNSNFTGNITITQSANGITITNDAGADTVAIFQRFIDKSYYDGKYTAVLKTINELIFGYTELVDSENNIYQTSFWVSTGATIVWAALYEGSYTADTLPPYVPKGYAAELAACNSASVDVGGGYGGGSLQAYPVGSIYMSVNSTSPASLFGGTWEQLKDRFLLGAGDIYAAGSIGGAATVELTTNQLPKITGYIEAGAGSSGSAEASGHGAFRSTSGIFTTSRQCKYRYAAGNDPWTSSDTDAWQQVNMSFGNNEAHNNMPPYLAVYMWRRVS